MILDEKKKKNESKLIEARLSFVKTSQSEKIAAQGGIINPDIALFYFCFCFANSTRDTDVNRIYNKTMQLAIATTVCYHVLCSLYRSCRVHS